MKNRIGLLGGTFNPVHCGHLEIGLKIGETFGLERVVYILSANPPHKRGMVHTPARIRWEMLNSALEPYPELVPCDVEMKRSRPSWTIKTIQVLKDMFPRKKLFFISGSEGFLKIKTWKSYRQLLESVFFVVLLREPSHLESIRSMLEPESVSCSLDPGEDLDLPGVYCHSYRSSQLQLSSTRIRRRLRSNESVAGLIPEGVLKIIEENDLYGS